MLLRSFMKWLYRQFGRRSFRTRQVLQRLGYLPYPVSRNAIYIAMHKCWKFELLSRDRFYGHSYIYRISNWGVRYVEEGYRYRKSEMQMKLLGYILEYSDDSEKLWTEEVLATPTPATFFSWSTSTAHRSRARSHRSDEKCG